MDKLTQDQVNEAMNKTYGNRAAFAAAVLQGQSKVKREKAELGLFYAG